MTSALIGYSGFVGTTLSQQRVFDKFYRASNIGDIKGQAFEQVVCAAAPAQKWLANKNPAADEKNIQQLIAHLRTMSCKQFILISTVDVFAKAIEVDEGSAVPMDNLAAYGKNRRLLELFVQEHFEQHLIVRLPGLVGLGLRKNAIYDLHHKNNVEAIDSGGQFQFYPMANLWRDIAIALRAKLGLLHLTSAPISMKEVAQEVFNFAFDNPLSATPPVYDFRTKHAALYGAAGFYQYDRAQVLAAIQSYASKETKTK